jgi:Skp family chaperone for outer membrane proteins
MSRRTVHLLILAVFALSFVSAGFAQQTGKIGVINSQMVLEKSAEGKRVIAQLQDRDKKSQGDLGRLDNEIKALETKLSTQRLTLTEEAGLQINSDLEKKRTDQKRLSEDAVRELQELQYRLFNKVQGELIPIIEGLGKEKGMDVILDLAKSGAVYVNPVIDMTDEVIRRYDASKAAPAK